MGLVRGEFRPAQGLGENHYDVLVIGSGMGGLTSAALLSQEGFKVCVVEQHYRPGGYLHRFFKKRVPFDTGFHYLGGLDEGGALARYFRFLGVIDQLTWHHLDPDGYDVLQFPDYEFRVPAGWEPYRKRLHEEFPSERAAIDAFCDACVQITKESFGYTLKRPPEEAGRYTTTTLGAFMKSMNCSERLAGVLAGQGYLYGIHPDRAPLELHALVIDSMMQGPAGVDGGGDALARVMVEKIKKHGGEVRTRNKVTSLEMKDGEVHCANLERNHGTPHASPDKIFARAFISNAHPSTTLDLLPPNTLRPAYVNRVKEMKNSLAATAGYFRSEATDAKRRNYNIYSFPSYDVGAMYDTHGFSDRPGDDGTALFLTFPSDREKDWEHYRVVLALGLMRFADVEKWGDSKTGKRSAEYQDFKQRQAEKMLAAVGNALPDHKGKLSIVDTSTPLTNRDYTGSPQGSIYGLEHSMDAWGKYALHARTRIDNLLLTGHSVLMPGIVGVTIGAFVTCSYLLGFEALFDRVAKA